MSKTMCSVIVPVYNGAKYLFKTIDVLPFQYGALDSWKNYGTYHHFYLYKFAKHPSIKLVLAEKADGTLEKIIFNDRFACCVCRKRVPINSINDTYRRNIYVDK